MVQGNGRAGSEGAQAVINTGGHYVARGRSTFEAIHGQGARPSRWRRQGDLLPSVGALIDFIRAELARELACQE